MTDDLTSHKDMPPDRITIACFTYMVRVMELRDFNRFFFGIINSSDGLSQMLTEESKKSFQDAATEYQVKTDNMATGRQLINEVLLTRSVETFELYFVQILRLIFSERTDLVIAEEKLNAEATKSDFSSPDEYFLFLAEQKLMRLSYKPLSALRQYIFTSTGYDPFESDTLFQTVILAKELRNLIAHNDCRINDIFQKRTANLANVPRVRLGYRFAINDIFLRKCLDAFDHIVFSCDESIAACCSLPTMNRLSSFFFRGDFEPATVCSAQPATAD